MVPERSTVVVGRDVAVGRVVVVDVVGRYVLVVVGRVVAAVGLLFIVVAAVFL